MENNEAFLGRGWSFPPEFFVNGGEVEMVSGEEDITQSLYILLSTSLRERTMSSGYGCDLSQYIFEEVDQGLINGLRGIVDDAIINNEPRIQTDSIDVDQSTELPGLISISIAYTVRSTNNRYNLVYPFYINEANQQFG